MRSRRPVTITHFRARLGVQDIRLVATPPDEDDPETDYRWQVMVPDQPSWPTGTGFTSHQAVHDLLERLELLDVTLTDVLQVHDDDLSAS
ncbi:MAG: hypothetical protein GEEBNDBF_00430 [bacterium]|nr:hypothetical protein [bacterium]